MSNRSTYLICAAILLNAAAIIGHREFEKAQVRQETEAIQKKLAAKEQAKKDIESLKSSVRYIGQACEEYLKGGDAAKYREDVSLWSHGLNRYADNAPETETLKGDLLAFNIVLQKSITATSDDTVRAAGAGIAALRSSYGIR